MTLLEQIDAKLAQVDANIATVKQHALDEVTRLQNLKAPLQQAKLKLLSDPSLADVITGLKDAL